MEHDKKSFWGIKVLFQNKVCLSEVIIFILLSSCCCHFHKTVKENNRSRRIVTSFSGVKAGAWLTQITLLEIVGQLKKGLQSMAAIVHPVWQTLTLLSAEQPPCSTSAGLFKRGPINTVNTECLRPGSVSKHIPQPIHLLQSIGTLGLTVYLIAGTSLATEAY